MNDTPKWLKWAILAAVAAPVAYFAIPIAAAMVWGTVQIVVGLMILAGLVIAAPALAEWAAQGSYWLYAKAIKGDPIAKLWREFKDFLDEIETVQENINLVAQEEENLKIQLDQNKTNFDQAEILDYQDKIGEVTDAKMFLMEERDRLKLDAEQMKKDIKKNEAHWKMGNALVKAAKAVDKAAGISAGTEGGRIALETIQARLAEGRGRLNVLKSQRSAADIKKAMEARNKARTIDGEVKEVPQRVSLTNNPSPVMSGLLVGGKTPVEARKTGAESLLDRI